MITFTRDWRGYAKGSSVGTLSATTEAIAVAEGAAAYDVVPLNAPLINMGQIVAPGALSFRAADGVVLGGSATVDVVADGVNTPTFSGMFPTNGSASYLNVAGAINSISFYRAAGVTWYSITNNANVVSGTYLVPITLLAQQNISVVGGGVYAATAGGTGNTASFTIDRSLPAGADGWIEATFDTGGDVAFTLGLDASGTNSAALLEGNNDYSVRCSLAGLLSVGANTTPATTGVTVSAASSQRTRLRRASGVITLEYSNDSGATWTLVYTWPGIDNSLLYAHFYTTYSTTAKRIVAPKTAGFVPI